MKIAHRSGILALLLVAQTACSEDVASNKKTDTVTTKISACKETIDNENAAYSRLSCDKIGNYKLHLSIQSPNLFEIELTRGESVITSDFYTIANEMPLEHGDKIVWLMENQQPTYAVVELSWGTEDAPFEMQKRVLVNKVEGETLCTLGVAAAPKSFDEALSYVTDNAAKLSCANSVTEF